MNIHRRLDDPSSDPDDFQTIEAQSDQTAPPQPSVEQGAPAAALSTFEAGVASSVVSSDATGMVASGGLAPETVTLAGSGLTFINTYDVSVGSDYHTAILYAEHELESHFTNAVTIRVNFGFQSLGSGIGAQNKFFNTTTVSYAQLSSALISHATSFDDIVAGNALPATAPSNGNSSSATTGFLIPAGLARVLGFEGPSSSLDDSVVLSTAITWNFDPNNRAAPGGRDAIGALEHEITEGGMGRIGGLGYQNNTWGPEDLFRFTASGVRDYTGGQDGVLTYFSPNGSPPDLSLPYHNSVDSSGNFDGFDPGDWDSTNDAFGGGGNGMVKALSATDLRLLDVLGWTEPDPQQPPNDSAVWLMSGLASGGSNTTQQLGPDWNPVLSGDFNGDGTSDVIWRNADSQTAIWFMNGRTASGALTTQQLTSDWHIEATGDFNGDGKTDILWRNSNTFHTAVWLMNGTTASGAETTQQLGPDWHVLGTGDFNGDGKADILWRNSNGQTAIWSSTGNGFDGAVTTQQLGSDWHVQAIGDFNGDGRSDLLWRNDNGQTALWSMNGTNASGALTTQQLGLDWHIIGTGDFNGDGRTDVLWRNDDGSLAIWMMNGTQASGALTQQQVGLDWRPVVTGDFNGDARSDILFRNDGIAGQFGAGWNSLTQHSDLI